MARGINPHEFLRDTVAAAAASGFSVDRYAVVAGTELPVLVRPPRTETAPRVYLSSGIHGDEPAGPLALLELLRTGGLPGDAGYTVFPLLNPTGVAAGTRENADGVDLNRDYTAFDTLEIGSQRAWLDRVRPPVDLALHLHEDWEASGFYLYELNFTGRPGCADAMIRAAGAHCGIETAAEIDGLPTTGPGLIRPEVIPEVPDGLPEAIFLQQRYGGLNYTLETPSGTDLGERVAAQIAAVIAAVECVGTTAGR